MSKKSKHILKPEASAIRVADAKEDQVTSGLTPLQKEAIAARKVADEAAIVAAKAAEVAAASAAALKKLMDDSYAEATKRLEEATVGCLI